MDVQCEYITKLQHTILQYQDMIDRWLKKTTDVNIKVHFTGSCLNTKNNR